MAALAKPGPISAATSATDTGASKLRLLPSGSVIVGMKKTVSESN
jgi:hypothetical protein